MGKRGSVEETVTNVYSTLESSGNLTAAGVPHVILMVHPTEGIIYSGEENVTRAVRDLVVEQHQAVRHAEWQIPEPRFLSEGQRDLASKTLRLPPSS